MANTKLSTKILKEITKHYLTRKATPSHGLSTRNFAANLNRLWGRNKNKSCKLVQPGKVSSQLTVPDHIIKPSYALTGEAEEKINSIDLKTDEAIECMRQSCTLAKTILNDVSKHLKVGLTTDEIDVIVHALCISNQAYPSPLNYHSFPKSVCTSVNNVACHGIPDNRPLEDGDIITIDVSVFVNNYHGDCAATYQIGSVDKRSLKLMEITKKCLYQSINVCRPGQKFSNIGKIIEKTAESAGFNVVPCFCGHGIGTYFHGYPEILHYKNQNDGVMQERMTFTIEPVISEGNPDIAVLEDGWTAVTLDNSRTAQYEHTILITKSGAEILT